MHSLHLLAAVVVMQSGSPAPSAPDQRRILVMPVEAKSGVARDIAEQVTTLLATEAARDPRLRVVGYKEIEGVLSVEQQRQLVMCDSVGCAAEIAGALDSEEVVFGSLGVIGNSMVLTLTRLKARASVVEQRVARRYPADKADLLLDDLPSVSAELFGRPPVAARPVGEAVTPAPLAPAPTAGAAPAPGAGSTPPAAAAWPVLSATTPPPGGTAPGTAAAPAPLALPADTRLSPGLAPVAPVTPITPPATSEVPAAAPTDDQLAAYATACWRADGPIEDSVPLLPPGEYQSHILQKGLGALTRRAVFNAEGDEARLKATESRESDWRRTFQLKQVALPVGVGAAGVIGGVALVLGGVGAVALWMLSGSRPLPVTQVDGFIRANPLLMYVVFVAAVAALPAGMAVGLGSVVPLALGAVRGVQVTRVPSSPLVDHQGFPSSEANELVTSHNKRVAQQAGLSTVPACTGH